MLNGCGKISSMLGFRPGKTGPVPATRWRAATECLDTTRISTSFKHSAWKNDGRSNSTDSHRSVPFPGSDPEMEGRIRYLKPIVDGNTGGPVIDIIPLDQQDQSVLFNADIWTFRFNNDLFPQRWGYWDWTIPWNFPTGAKVEFDIWVEYGVLDQALGYHWLYQDPGFGGSPGLGFGARTELRYFLNVMKDWDPAVEDWQLTFQPGNETPPSPTNTIKFSEMSNVTINQCGCQGEFTWPGVWDRTVLQATLDWKGEVAILTLESLVADEEFDGKSIVQYISGQDNDGAGSPSITLLTDWKDTQVNYEVPAARGYWGGDGRFFARAHDAKVGNPPDPHPT